MGSTKPFDRRHFGSQASNSGHNGKNLAPESESEDSPLLGRQNLKSSVVNEDRKSSTLEWLWGWIIMNRAVISLVSLLVGGVIALCIYFGVTYPQKSAQKKPAQICLTPACVLASAQILRNLSPRYLDIDPCTNFDKFVCEGWEESHDLRSDQRSMFTGTLMEVKSQQILRHVLESPYSDSGLSAESPDAAGHEIFDKVQASYDACMDERKLRELGSQPLLQILREVEKHFPAVRPHSTVVVAKQEEANHEGKLSHSHMYENKLSETIAFLESIGVTTLLSFQVSADDKDPDFVVLSINAPSQPGLPSKEYYQDKKVVSRYAQTIGQVLEGLLEEARTSSSWPFLELLHTRSEDLVRSIVELESILARATPDLEDAEDVTKYYNPLSLEELSLLFPEFSTTTILLRLAPKGYIPSQVIVGSPSYLRKVSEVVRETTDETLLAYFVWKTVQAYASTVSDDVLKPLTRFNNELNGKDPDAAEERWRTCVKFADNALGWILSKFFIERAFSEDAKNFGDLIVSEIRTQFVAKINNVGWMSADVRELAIEKVHNIVQKIGYPTRSPDIRNASNLRSYYEHVNISRASFLNNALSVSKFDVSQEWAALGKPTNRDEWGMTASTVNAYYNPAGNEIVFPAGIMQLPVFYDPEIPQYLSYGAFGAISGHELSHAFDSTGRHYDQNGNYTDWWDQPTIDAFQAKAQCFVDQYHEFTVAGPDNEPLHVNGRLTLGENIADAGGLSASFKAWSAHEEREPGQLLPGLQHFTKDQLFFISFSSWWCDKSRKEAAMEGIYRDPHSPKWARILGTMANSRQFKESFHCPTTEPRCELW